MFKHIIALLLLNIVFQYKLVYCYYNVHPGLDNTFDFPYRYKAATFVRNNSLYFWGGSIIDTVYNVKDSTYNYGDERVAFYFDSIQLDPDTGNINYSVVNGSVSTSRWTPLRYSTGACAVYLPDTDTVLFFGGFRKENKTLDTGTLYLVGFDFKTSEWKDDMPVQLAPGVNQTLIPLPTNHEGLEATLAPNGKIYIVGFQSNWEDTLEGYFMYEYDPVSAFFSPITINATFYDFSSVSFLLIPIKAPVTMPDGRFIYIADISSQLLIFDTNTNHLIAQNVTGYDTIPGGRGKDSEHVDSDSRVDGNAVLAPDGRHIYYYGGDYDPYDSTAHKSFNDIAILDTQTWAWKPPKIIDGEAPKPRILADTGVVLDKYWIVTHGVSHTGKLLNDINVVRLPDVSDPTGRFTWVANMTEEYAPSSLNEGFKTRLGDGKISGIVVACVAAAMIIVIAIYYHFSRRVRLVMQNMFRYVVWDLRAGEPRWTKASQLIFRIILLGIFSAYLGYNVKLVTNSPISTLTLISQVDEVTFPEIRLCFKGFDRMTLQLESGAMSTADLYQKGFVQEIIRENNTIIVPENLEFLGYDDDMSTTCYLFTPSDPFPIVKTTANDSVRFTLAYVGTFMESENFIYVELYPHGRNPNLATYNNTEQPFLSQQELELWQQTDIDDSQISNRYKVDSSSQNAIIYDLQTRRSLRNDSWNNIGFASIYDETPELVTTIESQALNDSLQIAAIDIYPRSMTNTVLQEQRIYTLIGVIGQVAGLFALLVTIDRVLFGAQPQSPWGIVQRLSVGRLRQSLLNKLYAAFGDMKRPVPFASPVNENTFLKRNHNGGSYHWIDNNIEQYEVPVPVYFDRKQDANERNLRDNNNRSSGDIQLNLDEPLNDTDSTVALASPDTPKGVLESRVNDIESHLGQIATTYQQLANITLNNHIELQRRVQLMEVLLKTYYIDDEIFLKLEKSHENMDKTRLGDRNGSGSRGGISSKDTLLESNNDLSSQTTNNNEQNSRGISEIVRRFRNRNNKNYNSVEEQLSEEIPSPSDVNLTTISRDGTNGESRSHHNS